MYNNRHLDWSKFLDSFGEELLASLGVSSWNLPRDKNPITEELKSNPHFVETWEADHRFNRTSLARVATICQMNIYDANGGPDEDNKPKVLRRHWYAWFKTQFSFPFADQLGDYEVNSKGHRTYNDRKWSALLSAVYAGFVDSGEVTYKDLWVEDGSRMMERTWDKLFRGCNILLCVEKDSLFPDFVDAANALGATSIYSGKGKSSKAAIEKCLRENFGWRDYHERSDWYEEPFSWENPLIILHISDHDFDGEAVIGPTFGEQSRRYTQHIVEARIEIKPQHLEEFGYDPTQEWYSVKTSNKGYLDWAEEKAMFLATCNNCQQTYPVIGLDETKGQNCPHCWGEHDPIDINLDTPKGFEVEAMKTREYKALIVRTLLEVLPFEDIIDGLRDNCFAEPWEAAQQAVDKVAMENPDYAALVAEIERLEEIKTSIRDEFIEDLRNIAEPHKHDWRDEDDDPEPEQFVSHVERSSNVWRPFSVYDRTEKLTEWLLENADYELDELKNREIDWKE